MWTKIVIALVALILVLEINSSLEANKKECRETVMLNKTNYPWNAYDHTVLAGAMISCGFKYKKSPCVATFTKTGPQDYIVICGEKK